MQIKNNSFKNQRESLRILLENRKLLKNPENPSKIEEN